MQSQKGRIHDNWISLKNWIHFSSSIYSFNLVRIHSWQKQRVSETTPASAKNAFRLTVAIISRSELMSPKTDVIMKVYCGKSHMKMFHFIYTEKTGISWSTIGAIFWCRTINALSTSIDLTCVANIVRNPANILVMTMALPSISRVMTIFWAMSRKTQALDLSRSQLEFLLTVYS